MTTNPAQPRHWRLVEFHARRAMRDAPAARVEVDTDGEWLWMTPRDIRLNIRDHGDHPELRKALAAYGCAKGQTP
ncbi:hypothetical protein [Delftia tsuruhatensis]|jgi:hypothetical protein|uniref:hypothetical protein n=1 Tax=Delftia tsuruhatensis TaxID=180282 RepID=UPI00370CDACC